jgi:hypothetical protein
MYIRFTLITKYVKETWNVMPEGLHIDIQEQYAAHQRSKEKLINEQHKGTQ